MNITAEELTELLGQAFDKGWTGYKDLRESLVESMVEEFKKNHKVELPKNVGYVDINAVNYPSDREFQAEYQQFLSSSLGSLTNIWNLSPSSSVFNNGTTSIPYWSSQPTQ